MGDEPATSYFKSSFITRNFHWLERPHTFNHDSQASQLYWRLRVLSALVCSIVHLNNNLLLCMKGMTNKIIIICECDSFILSYLWRCNSLDKFESLRENFIGNLNRQQSFRHMEIVNENLWLFKQSFMLCVRLERQLLPLLTQNKTQNHET